MSLSTQKKRVHLSLKKKVEVITTAEKNRSLSLKALGELFGCGKTQIGKILKNKENILASYEANASAAHSVSLLRVCRGKHSAL
jgi:alpha-tubulin suppressor-like RCC1 family protein